MNAAWDDQTAPWPGGLQELEQCPVCGDRRQLDELEELRDLTYGAAPGTWSLIRCARCSAAYLNPRPAPNSIHLAYGNYFTHVPPASSTRSVPALLKHALANGYRNSIYRTKLRPSLALGAVITPLFPALAQHIRDEDRGIGLCEGRDKRILDLGCGNGHFLQVARKLGWQSYGMDADAAAAAAARHCGEILGARVEDLDARYDGFFDVITLSHVIEHVHDPVGTLSHCLRVMRPGGYLWLETPNIDSIGYRTFGRHWRGLETPRHLVLFNAASLQTCLTLAGFERVHVLPPRDVTEHLFLLSASMQLGRIAERDRQGLPHAIRQRLKQEVSNARSLVRRAPGKSEFVAVVAYR